MHLGMLLGMAADGMAERIAIGPADKGITYAELGERAKRAGALFAATGAAHVGLVDTNSPAVPLALFGAAAADMPFVPITYRLDDDRLRALVVRTAPAVIVVGEGMAERIGPVEGVTYLPREQLLEAVTNEAAEQADLWEGDSDSIGVLLYTSGTTGEPKAAVLRHRNLASYVVSTVEYMAAAEDECALVSVPPYHVAGVTAVLSSTYGGRRVVYLESFAPDAWVDLARREHVTHAMVVPTMLDRILDVVEADVAAGKPGLPDLRNLSYGGGPMPLPVIERALRVLPGVGFVNAYGLTETSSTIAVLGPDDHFAAYASTDPAARARLGSVGRPLPTLEVTIRDPEGQILGVGEVGEIWVRGDQVAGEYLGREGSATEGWFATRDGGHLDEEGFLFVHGRLDDVIVRGGENLSPGEIEKVLLEHPAVLDAAVVGIPDRQWGEKVAAAVVLRAGHTASEDELQAHVRGKLRSTMTPEVIAFRAELPFNDTGKLLRRVLREELAQPSSEPV